VSVCVCNLQQLVLYDVRCNKRRPASAMHPYIIGDRCMLVTSVRSLATASMIHNFADDVQRAHLMSDV